MKVLSIATTGPARHWPHIGSVPTPGRRGILLGRRGLRREDLPRQRFLKRMQGARRGVLWVDAGNPDK